MDTRKTFLAASAVALGLFAVPVLSQAFEGDQSERWGHRCRQSADANEMHGWARMADRLNLSEEQRQTINAIDDKYRPELRTLRQALVDNRAALAKADLSDARVRELADAQGKTIADMIVARKHMRSEMVKVLTEEQRQQLGKLFERRWHHKRGHDGMGQG